MKYFLIFTCLVILNPLIIDAQAVNGTWVGNYARVLFNSNPKSLVIELSLYNDSLLTGASHLYYGGGIFEHHKISGKYHPKDSTATFYETFVETNSPLGVYEVTYSMKMVSYETFWRLQGKWKGTESIFGYLPFNKVSLEKLKDTVEKKQITIPAEPVEIAKDSNLKKDFPGIRPDLAAQKEISQLGRVTDIQKIIEVSQAERDSIYVDVYDNGEVDNDSISVYLNDRPVVKNQMISDKPVSFYLSLDKKAQFQKVKMVAESLGSIPPNTAIMIITTGKHRYEVRMSSDLEKNAVVEFVLTE